MLIKNDAFGKSFQSKIALFLSVALIAIITSILTPSARAQETGQVSGTATDATGAAVARVGVSVKNLKTNAVRSVTTNASGQYTISGLLPTLYELSTDGSGGFNTFTIKIEITVGGRLTQDVKLSIGSAVVSVDVASEGGSQVNTQTQELSQVVSSRFVSQLPSLTRNPYDFVALSGNISSGDSSGPGGTSGTAGQQNNGQSRGAGFSINGQRASGTEILLDGVENINLFSDGVGIYVPLDGTQEFRIVTSNFEPQYGRASGGVVNVTTKGGGNAFHGTVWEYNRLSAYTANTVTNAQLGQPKGTYTRNQFGFAVGGPILKNKLFFFGSTEWTRVRSSAVLNGGVPTPQFLALAAPNIQSYFQQYGGGNNFKFINTVSAADAGIKKIPGDTPALGTVSYIAPANAGGGNPQNTYNILGRFDYNP